MEDASEPKKPAFSKTDVLNALDFEIGHRESMLSRHGFSSWGVIAATCALLWACTTEALNGTHNATHVLLVLLLGQGGVGFLVSPWTKALGLWSLEGASPETLKELILRLGIVETGIVHNVLFCMMMLGVAIYLGFKGFVLLSVIASVFYIFGLLKWGFCWIILRARLPLRLPVQATERKSKSKYLGALVGVLVLAVALVPLQAIASVWPIDAADARLGLLLAAFSTLWTASLIIIRPPTTTASLQELRSKLAFGEIETEEARMKALYILRGTPDEFFLTSKADKAVAELKQSSRLFRSLAGQLEEVVSLAEKLKAADCSEPVLHAVSREFRTLFGAMLANTRAVDAHMKRAADLRVQLDARIEAGSLFLNLSPEIGNAALARVSAALHEVENSRIAFGKAVDAEGSKAALDFIHSVQRNLKLPRNQTPYQLIRACFGD